MAKMMSLVGCSVQNSAELCSSAEILQVFEQNFIFCRKFSLADPSICLVKCSGHIPLMSVLVQILTPQKPLTSQQADGNNWKKHTPSTVCHQSLVGKVANMF